MDFPSLSWADFDSLLHVSCSNDNFDQIRSVANHGLSAGDDNPVVRCLLLFDCGNRETSHWRTRAAPCIYCVRVCWKPGPFPWGPSWNGILFVPLLVWNGGVCYKELIPTVVWTSWDENAVLLQPDRLLHRNVGVHSPFAPTWTYEKLPCGQEYRTVSRELLILLHVILHDSPIVLCGLLLFVTIFI